MEEKTISFDLNAGEAADIIRVLDELPTKANAWPLVQKLKAQFDAQVEKPEEQAEAA